MKFDLLCYLKKINITPSTFQLGRSEIRGYESTYFQVWKTPFVKEL